MINKIVRMPLTHTTFSYLLNMEEVSGCALINVLREFSHSVNRGVLEGVCCAEIIYEFLKAYQAYLLGDECRT